MCFANSFIVFAEPLKAINCLGATTRGDNYINTSAALERERELSTSRRCNAYLMSSMVRRAELQTISRATELLSVCCFWTFAHLGQTVKEQMKIINKQAMTQKLLGKKKKGTEEINLETALTLF